MKVSELVKPNLYLQLRQLSRKKIKLSWFDDYLDGPITGMLIFQDRKYWFHLCDENTQTIGEMLWYRRYLVIELSDEQIAEEDYWHALFREKVGHHTDFDERGYLSKDHTIHSEASQKEFFEAYKERVEPNYLDNDVIGWFEL